MTSDTIFALATPRGVSGVAVIRISGPDALSVISKMTRGLELGARQLTYASLFDPVSGGLLDRGMVVQFEGPHSFSGEDVAELHLHGSRAVIGQCEKVLAALGCRPAVAGEFTRRAFEAGKFDLTQVEALSDLLAAETDGQRQQAIRQMGGGLTELYAGWRERLIRVLAMVEAEVDFPDEDVAEGQWRNQVPEVDRLLREIRDHIDDAGRGQVLREGVEVVLVGPANVGKSSLLNALARQDVAIVSDIAGTTRDVVESRLDLSGIPVIFRDTAGVRESSDQIEEEGVKRARQAAEAGAIRLWLGSHDTEWDGALLELFDEVGREHDLLVQNKCDACEKALPVLRRGEVREWQGVSAKTGAGVADLLTGLSAYVAEAYGVSDSPALTRLRHRRHLSDCADCLQGLLALETLDIAVVAEHIRLALRELGAITGQVNVEEILDLVFGEFCIGK